MELPRILILVGFLLITLSLLSCTLASAKIVDTFEENNGGWSTGDADSGRSNSWSSQGTYSMKVETGISNVGIGISAYISKSFNLTNINNITFDANVSNLYPFYINRNFTFHVGGDELWKEDSESVYNGITINVSNYTGDCLLQFSIMGDGIDVYNSYVDNIRYIGGSRLDVSEGELIQDPKNIYDSPYDADFNNDIPFSREVAVKNAYDDRTYINSTVNASLPKDTLNGTIELYDPEGDLCPDTLGDYECTNVSYNSSSSILSWDIDEVENQTTQYWKAYFNVTNLNVSSNNKTGLYNGRNYWRKLINVSSNYTGIESTKYYSEVKNPENITSVELYLNGTKVSDGNEYRFEFIDTNSDGIEDYVRWFDNSIDGLKNWELRGLIGKPIKSYETPVIENRPVLEDKNIEWRHGIKLWNRNDYSVDYSYKVVLPSNSFEVKYKEDLVQPIISGGEKYYTIDVTIPANSNKTAYLYYKTGPIKVTSVTDKPDVYYVNESAEFKKTVTLSNYANSEVSDVQTTINLNYGEDFLVLFQNGTTREEHGKVVSDYVLNVSSIEANGVRKFILKYKVPTAYIESIKDKSVENEGNGILYNILSRGEIPLEPLRLKMENYSCNQITKAENYNTGEQYDIICNKDFEAEIELGKFGVGDEAEVLVNYKTSEKLLDPNLLTTFNILGGGLGLIFLVVGSILMLKIYISGGDRM